MWLTYRASYLKNPSFIPWDLLARQFGSGYSEVKHFKAAFIAELKKVITVYAGAKVDAASDGLTVYPMRTHVQKQIK
jgi:hypothetical protein